MPRCSHRCAAGCFSVLRHLAHLRIFFAALTSERMFGSLRARRIFSRVIAAQKRRTLSAITPHAHTFIIFAAQMVDAFVLRKKREASRLAYGAEKAATRITLSRIKT
jgi:hypothetical protein